MNNHSRGKILKEEKIIKNKRFRGTKYHMRKRFKYPKIHIIYKKRF